MKKNGGSHPSLGKVDTRLLNRMRFSAVSATYGAGMHPNQELWINEPRHAGTDHFIPENKYR